MLRFDVFFQLGRCVVSNEPIGTRASSCVSAGLVVLPSWVCIDHRTVDDCSSAVAIWPPSLCLVHTLRVLHVLHSVHWSLASHWRREVMLRKSSLVMEPLQREILDTLHHLATLLIYSSASLPCVHLSVQNVDVTHLVGCEDISNSLTQPAPLHERRGGGEKKCRSFIHDT